MSRRYDLVARGRLVTPETIIDGGWMAVAEGRIAAIGTGPLPDSAQVHDAGEGWIIPGVVDGQTHAGSYQGLSGIESTTRSAVAGGITTIVDMPYDNPDPLTSVETLDAKIAAIGELAHCGVALYATVAKGQSPDALAELARRGVCAIKLSWFESHPVRFPRIPADQTLDVLIAAAELGLPVGLHNEDQEIVHGRIARMKAEGHSSIAAHSASRPEASELAATAAFLELGAVTGAHVHIVHISVPRGFQLVERYRSEGVNATAELCVHYLVLDESIDGKRLGARMKVNPPIRSGVREGLWEELDAGRVAFVSTDHSSWPLSGKNVDSIFDAGAGVPGLETLVPVFFTGLVARQDSPVRNTVRYLCEKPARFFGLWPRKGALMVGSDADFAVIEPASWTYDSAKAHDDLNWSPFDGERFSVRVASTFVRGKQAWDGMAIRSTPGDGGYVRRNAVPAINREETVA